MSGLRPAILFGHGNPVNAVGGNAWTEGWQRSVCHIDVKTLESVAQGIPRLLLS